MFNLNLKGVSTDSVSIVAARTITPNLSRVIISCVGQVTPEKIKLAIAKQLNGFGSIVESSFRRLDLPEVGKYLAVGYVRANREVRIPTESEIKANYRVLSSNILMSNEDRSLWEVKKGKATTYLARHGNEDLSELVSLATANSHPVSSVTAAVTASVQPQKFEFVTFVNEFSDVDHGFVLSANSKNVKLVAMSNRNTVVTPVATIINAHQVKIDPLMAKAVKKQVEANTQDGSWADAEDYYKELFAYDPAYMQEFLDDIKQTENAVA